MPLWLWQEVQALPWSTEIVALTCVPRIACDPRRPYSSVHGKLVVQHRPKTNKRWNAAAFEQSQFFDHTPSPVHMIKLTMEREITPYPWVHPDDDDRR
jgi:hypothetical protein